MSKLIAVVMAAGHGTRMKSSLPKVVHPACGRPLVYYPVQAAIQAGAVQVVVVVNPTSRTSIEHELSKHVDPARMSYAVQEVPRGTGDAVRAALEAIETRDHDRILVLSGDTPLLQAEDLESLLESMTEDVALSFMFFRPTDPTGYGRIIRNDESMPIAIIEQKDLVEPAHHAINEVNAGLYLARVGQLRQAVWNLRNDNAQSEYYLTDVVSSIAVQDRTCAVEASPESLAGVNDRKQLCDIEQILFRRILERHAMAGVSFVGNALVDDTVVLAPDVRIEAGVRLRGETTVGARSVIDVGAVITDTSIGEDAYIKPYCVLSESTAGRGVQLGPFAHLRPNSVLRDHVHVGNFVETKNAELKEGAKANHLAYIGDAEVGQRSNLGAGTIICNYDGFMKRRTIIGADVFVGSDSQLIAPVHVGDSSYVATGTTVTEDVPEGALSIGRARQVNKPGYAAPLRESLKARAEAEKAKK